MKVVCSMSEARSWSQPDPWRELWGHLQTEAQNRERLIHNHTAWGDRWGSVGSSLETQEAAGN